ncbi:hypothetical protein BJ912DRAFT_960767 [Pholiota molesta]|nr:hypothetical protein BJ912DRAFT_960767 [Pholiota molesta]
MDRPANRYTFPVALFDQNLALLQYRLENLGVVFGSDKARQLFPDELTFRAAADQFISVAIEDYPSKDARMEASRPFLETIFGDSLELEYPLATNKTLSVQGNMSTTTLDGAYVTMIKAIGFPKITRVILGVKSSAYEGDALSQMTKGFAEEVYGFKDKNYFDSTYFPKILVALNGHKLEISIAVCLETVVVNQILSLDIQDNMFRSELQQKLSRVAEALKACSAQLDAYYSKLAAKRMPSYSFPSPTLEPLDSSKPLVLQGALEALSAFPGLRIVARLDRYNDEMRQKPQPGPADMRHNLFLAEQLNADDSSAQLIVKVVKRYGQAAHHCLAKGMLAPRLLLCQPIIGNLIIVVMERAKGRPLNSFIGDDLLALNGCLVFNRLKEALTLLEREKLVHGDLRDVNIMVDDSNPQAVTVSIVDFDWAVKHDEGFYPDNINVEELRDRWHSDVGPSKKMKIEHDKFAILNLLGPRYFGITEQQTLTAS